MVFAACDVAYLRHAKALISSMDLVSPGYDFVLHIVNASEDELQGAVDFGDALTGTRLHVTGEAVTLDDPEAMRTYYACARFVRLAELLERTETPFLVLDADGVFVAPIDLDFTDKADAQLCLPIRGLEDGNNPLHLRVAAGAVWVRPLDSTRAFFSAVAHDLLGLFGKGEATWYADQEALARHLQSGTGNVVARNIKQKYVDWDFAKDAVIWTGKGKRKDLDLGYMLLRNCFDPDPELRMRAHAQWDAISRTAAMKPDSVLGRMFKLDRKGGKRSFAIYLPRLDLPWKEGAMGRGGPQAQTEDAIELRLWWKRFTMALSHALTRSGYFVSTIEIPAWDITPARVDQDGFDFAFIPHRCRSEFQTSRTPVAFYMQEFFRHVFVVDEDGWSAASSVYPVDADRLPGAVLGAWDDYRERFARGELASKMAQAPSMSRDDLLSKGMIPSGKYAFFPLQIPHDQSIRNFSDVSQLDALLAAAEAFGKAGMAMVLKEHPANRASANEYRMALSGQPHIHWSDANVHDLVRCSHGVVTLNSGVGFEALIVGRPVVTFARVEYDAVTHHATPATFWKAWKAAVTEDPDIRMTRYSRFVDWFLARHAVDLSRPHAASQTLYKIISRAMDRIEDGQDA
ncbi:MAG: hypothetical protein QM612_01355 [Thermomonas sp.]|uniref:capsular polysaccharide export protein, LipB/KpsS family n=1 Tax=Thermomonas sp. TaxID=1971895 RepID=UPI0039E601B5